MDASRPERSLQFWRREQRSTLIERRMALSRDERRRHDSAIEHALYPLLIETGARVVSLYWPFRGEFNTRGLMRRLATAGVRVALPEVAAANAPLVFRPWRPDTPMRRGVYGIPVPDTSAEVHPQVVVAPLVGFDAAGFRLGYGGGYYDRTLAVLDPPALSVGVGYECSRITSVRPAAHDVSMHRIVTETGVCAPTSAGAP